MKRESHFPPGWDAERVRCVLEYYESQTEDEAVAEHEAAYEDTHSMMAIPKDLVPPSMRTPRESRQSTVNSNRKLIPPLLAYPGCKQPGAGGATDLHPTAF